MIPNLSPDGDPEFQIIKRPNKVRITETRKCVPRHGSSIKLIPAWNDEDNTQDNIEKCALRQSSILDAHSILSRKRNIADQKCETIATETLHGVISRTGEVALDFDSRMCRLSDANMERLSCAALTSVEFNRSYRIFMTTSVDTSLALFNFGKAGVNLLEDLVFERFPITSAKFTHTGDAVILTGMKNYFKVYDLNANKAAQMNVTPNMRYGEKLKSVKMAPKSSLAAFSGSNAVYLVDLRSFEKTNTSRVSGTAVSHCFSQDGDILNVFSSDGCVFMFDLRQNARPVHRWNDYSCTGGCSFAVSDDSKYIACGSESGYVNIYQWDEVMRTTAKWPKPMKSVGNLTTAVDQLLFHPSSQLLYMSSSLRTGAARLFDLDSQQVYAKFPVCMGRLGSPTSVGFSPRGGYLAVGQACGRAALYTFDRQEAKY